MTVKIHSGINKVRNRSYPQFTIAYYSGGVWSKRRFANLTAARREAAFVAEKLASGENDLFTLRAVDRVIYLEAIKELSPLKVSLNLAVMEYVAATGLPTRLRIAIWKAGGLDVAASLVMDAFINFVFR